MAHLFNRCLAVNNDDNTKNSLVGVVFPFSYTPAYVNQPYYCVIVLPGAVSKTQSKETGEQRHNQSLQNKPRISIDLNNSTSSLVHSGGSSGNGNDPTSSSPILSLTLMNDYKKQDRNISFFPP